VGTPGHATATGLLPFARCRPRLAARASMTCLLRGISSRLLVHYSGHVRPGTVRGRRRPGSVPVRGRTRRPCPGDRPRDTAAAETPRRPYRSSCRRGGLRGGRPESAPSPCSSWGSSSRCLDELVILGALAAGVVGVAAVSTLLLARHSAGLARGWRDRLRGRKAEYAVERRGRPPSHPCELARRRGRLGRGRAWGAGVGAPRHARSRADTTGSVRQAR